jgi:hypothetical protein
VGDLDEEAPVAEVLVVEEVVGSVERPDGEPTGLPLAVRLVRRPEQEERLARSAVPFTAAGRTPNASPLR